MNLARTFLGKYKVPMVISVLILMTGISSDLYGQIKQDTATKWEVGFDLRSPFFKNRDEILETTYGLIVKRRIKPNLALRFRTNFGADYDQEPLVKSVNPYSYTFSVDLGFERQKRVKNLVTYWGGEANIRYINANSYLAPEGRDPLMAFEIIHINSKLKYPGASLFAGGKYFLTNHISLSIESNLTLRYEMQVRSIQTYSQEGIPKSSIIRGNRVNAVTAKIVPLSVFYLNFHF